MTLPLFEQIGRLLVRKRKLFLFCIVLLLVGSGYSIVHRIQNVGIPLDFTPQAIFMDNSDMMFRLQEIESQFGREDNDIILLLHGANLQSEEGKEALVKFHTIAEETPHVVSVFSLWNAKHLKGTEGLLEVQDIWEENPFELAAQDPFLQER